MWGIGIEMHRDDVHVWAAVSDRSMTREYVTGASGEAIRRRRQARCMWGYTGMFSRENG